MPLPRLRTIAIAAAAAASLAGCTTYDDGWGYHRAGAGYDRYCDPHWDSWCDSYSTGYGQPWYGWYNNYYYPGIGIYVFDRFGRRYRWGDDHRRYWEGRRHHYRGRDWNDRRWENWGGFRGHPGQWQRGDRREWRQDRGEWREDRREMRGNWRDYRQERRRDDRAYREDRRDDRQRFRRGEITRDQLRQERREDRQGYRRDSRQDRRELRREQRRARRD